MNLADGRMDGMDDGHTDIQTEFHMEIIFWLADR